MSIAFVPLQGFIINHKAECVGKRERKLTSPIARYDKEGRDIVGGAVHAGMTASDRNIVFLSSTPFCSINKSSGTGSDPLSAHSKDLMVKASLACTETMRMLETLFINIVLHSCFSELEG